MGRGRSRSSPATAWLKGRQGDPCVGLAAPPDGHDQSVSRGVLSSRAGQTALAEPGVADEGESPALARRGPAHQVVERAELAVPADDAGAEDGRHASTLGRRSIPVWPAHRAGHRGSSSPCSTPAHPAALVAGGVGGHVTTDAGS